MIDDDLDYPYLTDLWLACMVHAATLPYRAGSLGKHPMWKSDWKVDSVLHSTGLERVQLSKKTQKYWLSRETYVLGVIYNNNLELRKQFT